MNFKIFGKIFRLSILFIVFLELLSFASFLVPEFGTIVFWSVLVVFFFLTLKRVDYGLLVLFAELFIGSKGYLFEFSFGGISVSIRLAFFLIIMFVWLGKMILLSKNKRKEMLALTSFKKTYLPYLGFLFIFIAWGVLGGVLNGNMLSNIFFDVNGWLYFALVFPLYFTTRKGLRFFSDLNQVFWASMLWVSVKTYFLLYIFSHNMISIIPSVYKWVRVTGVGEITKMDTGFSRIFFQSHIYIFIAFLILLSFLIFKKYNKKELLCGLSALSALFGVILISYSRSNWVGLFSALVLFGLYILVQKKWKLFFKKISFILISLFFGVVFIIAVIRFPIPSYDGVTFDPTDISDRAVQISGEAGVSSRWKLLQPMFDSIKTNPILGSGYGSLVTYYSSDPRVLESDASGRYTTFSFEWGWLDIWLKLGIFGFGIYLLLISKILFREAKALFSVKIFQNKEIYIFSLIISLLLVSFINFFSPYFNHPLGIGFLLIISSFFDFNKLLTTKS